MNREAVLEKLIDDIGKLLDGHENATAIQALMSTMVVCTLMSVPPNGRDNAMKYIFKTMREMMRKGTNNERQYIQ